MGCGSSKGAESPRTATAHKEHSNRGSTRSQASAPKTKDVDIGLRDILDYVKPLGQGGTGQTLLYRTKDTGESVAVKLIKRPIPKVIMPNILR